MNRKKRPFYLRKMWWKTKWWFFKYDIPNFFRNIWIFRKSLWKFRPWDGGYNLMIFRESLEYTLECMTNGHEEPVSLRKKLDKIKRAIKLLKNVEEDNFIERAESELGSLDKYSDYPDLDLIEYFNRVETQTEIEHRSKVYRRREEIEESEWKELWEIIKGQDHEVFRTYYKNVQKNENESDYDFSQKKFDGSGIKTWWD